MSLTNTKNHFSILNKSDCKYKEIYFDFFKQLFKVKKKNEVKRSENEDKVEERGDQVGIIKEVASSQTHTHTHT